MQKNKNSFIFSILLEEKLIKRSKIIPPIKNLKDVNCNGDQCSIAIFCGTKVEPHTTEAINKRINPLIFEKSFKTRNYFGSFFSKT